MMSFTRGGSSTVAVTSTATTTCVFASFVQISVTLSEHCVLPSGPSNVRGLAVFEHCHVVVATGSFNAIRDCVYSVFSAPVFLQGDSKTRLSCVQWMVQEASPT
jgi:hypothetical protein